MEREKSSFIKTKNSIWASNEQPKTVSQMFFNFTKIFEKNLFAKLFQPFYTVIGTGFKPKIRRSKSKFHDILGRTLLFTIHRYTLVCSFTCTVSQYSYGRPLIFTDQFRKFRKITNCVSIFKYFSVSPEFQFQFQSKYVYKLSFYGQIFYSTWNSWVSKHFKMLYILI